jgi:glycosyltransferase involved in cell wall biosynthesis
MTAPLSVLHVSTAENEGGSGRAAWRIHRGLKALGHQSHMLVGTASGNDPDVDTVHGGGIGRLKDRLAEEVTRRLGWQYLYYPSRRRVLRHPWVTDADIIQLYNTHGGYFSHRWLPALSRQAPVVWRLSDMWPLTGHCAYAGDCGRWREGCGACPDLATYPPVPRDTTAKLWRIKQQSYRLTDLTIVTPSRWLEEIAQASPLFAGCAVHRIPNGLDLDVFRPVDKAAARTVLGLDPARPVVAFAAHVLDDNPRKGGHLLMEALARCDAGTMPPMLLLLGVDGGKLAAQSPWPVHALGYIRDDRLLAAAYAAADVVAAPSLAENLSNSLLEAMACGTPVLAFDAGGTADAVRHRENGWLAKAGDAASLADGLSVLLGDGDLRQKLGAEARRTIETEFEAGLQARRFASLYADLADARRAGG